MKIRPVEITQAPNGDYTWRYLRPGELAYWITLAYVLLRRLFR